MKNSDKQVPQQQSYISRISSFISSPIQKLRSFSQKKKDEKKQKPQESQRPVQATIDLDTVFQREATQKQRKKDIAEYQSRAIRNIAQTRDKKRSYSNFQREYPTVPPIVYKPDFYFDESGQVYEYDKAFKAQIQSQFASEMMERETISTEEHIQQNIDQILTEKKNDLITDNNDLIITILEGQRATPQFEFQQIINTEEREQKILQKLKDQDKKEEQLEYVFAKLRDSLVLQNRGKVSSMDSQSQIPTTKYQFYPHCTYQNNPNAINIPTMIFENFSGDFESVSGKIFKEINAACILVDKAFYIWNISNPINSCKKEEFAFPLVNADLVYEMSSNKMLYYILIASTDQIIAYTFQNLSGNQISFALLDSALPVPTERLNMSRILQVQDSQRIFIGGQNGYLSELQIIQSKSLISSLFSQQPGSRKMKKIDQNQSIYDKLFKSFINFSGQKEVLLVDMCFQSKTNSLFVAIEDFTDKEGSEGYIDVYDLGRTCKDFKKSITIQVKEIFNDIETIMDMSIGKSYRQSNKIKYIVCDEIGNHILRIIFANGLRVDILIQSQSLTQEERIQLEDGKTIIKDHYYPKNTTWRILKVHGSPLEQAIESYKDLWEVPIDIGKEFIWRPLITIPKKIEGIGFKFYEPSKFSVLLYKTLQSYELFVVEYQNNETYMILLQQVIQYQNSYRNQSVEFIQSQEYYHLVVSVVKIEKQQKIMDISLKFENSRLTIKIFSEEGINTYTVPFQMDILTTYLYLMNLYCGLKKLDILSKVESDFLLYLNNQNQNQLLISLVEIFTKTPNKDQILISSQSKQFYDNYFQIMNSKPQSYSAFIKILLQTLKNYKETEFIIFEKVSQQLQEAAFQQFIEISKSQKISNSKSGSFQKTMRELSSRSKLVTNLLVPEEYENISEYQKIEAFYSFISRTLSKIHKTPLFAMNQNKELRIYLNPSVIKNLLSIMRNLYIQIEKEKQKIIQCENENMQNVEEDQSIEGQLNKLIIFLKRTISGLTLIEKLWEYPKIQAVFNQLSLEKRIRMSSISLMDYIQEGVNVPSLCELIEFYLQSFEYPQIMESARLTEFEKISADFLPSHLIDLFVARKCLQTAFESKVLQQKSQLRLIGLKGVFKDPTKTNLQIVAIEFLKNDLINQLVEFALRKAEDIEIVQKYLLNQTAARLNQEEIDDQLKIWENEKQGCFFLIKELLKVVIDRITEIQLTSQKEAEAKQENELMKTSEKKEQKVIVLSEFQGINIFKQKLAGINDFQVLLKVKTNIIQQSVRHNFELFHYNFYDFLLQEKLVNDLVKLKTPYIKQYLRNMVEKENEQMKAQKFESVSEKQQFMASRIEATYKHFSQLRQFEECFIYLMRNVLDSELVMDIKERISWISKAEGCLQMIPQNKRNSDDLLKEQCNKFHQNKEFLYLILQTRDKLGQKMKRNPELNEKEVSHVIQTLTLELIEPNLLYEIQIEYRMWLLVLRSLQIFEYENAQTIDEEVKLQGKIDSTYRELIQDKYHLPLTQRQFDHFKKKILKIHQQSIGYKKKNVEFLPLTFLIDLIQQENVEFFEKEKIYQLINEKVESEGEWSMFWLMDFIIENKILSFGELFKTISKLLKLDEDPAPEKYFDFAHLVIKWSQNTYEIDSAKENLHAIQYYAKKFKDQFKDELVYHKDYYNQVMILVQRLMDSIEILKR